MTARDPALTDCAAPVKMTVLFALEFDLTTGKEADPPVAVLVVAFLDTLCARLVVVRIVVGTAATTTAPTAVVLHAPQTVEV